MAWFKDFSFWLDVYGALQWVILLVMIPIVLGRQRTPTSGLAWLLVVFLHPMLGMILYILFGTQHLGRLRVKRQRQVSEQIRSQRRLADLSALAVQPVLDDVQRPLVLQAQKISNLPIVGGNRVEFIGASAAVIDRLAADIEGAEKFVHLLFFIVGDDASGRKIGAVLQRAVKRGVQCRFLVDEVGSRKFFRRGGLADELRLAGVEVAKAMPVARFRRNLTRIDLRNHRKIAVVDGRLAYAGSQNLIDADYGGRKGGPWHDLMGRLEGPIVTQLHLVFLEDWAAETGQILENPVFYASPASVGNVPAQVVATGPDSGPETFRRILIAAINAARHKLVLTTPYFVPDEPTLLALGMAADRGVDIRLVLPKGGDHPLVAAAGRAYYSAFMDSGAAIYQFPHGLVHTKSTTVDDAFAIFGSANLDIRSFSLNFEVNLLLFGEEVTRQLRAEQEKYLSDSVQLDREQWAARPVVRQYAERAVALLSPLL